MALPLSIAHLAQIEAASRALLGPLEAADGRAWLLAAGRLVNELVGGERLLVMSPEESGRYHSEDAPEVVQGVADFVEDVTPAGIVYSDPVVRTWYRLRRQRGQEVLTWDESRALVEEEGHRMMASPIVADVLHGQRYNDFAVLVRSTPTGDAMIWALHRTPGGMAFGERTSDVLTTLLPSFRAGLDAFARVRAHQAALDHLAEPVAAFSADARPLYRNAALAGALAADPEAARVEAALAALARELTGLAFPRRGREAAVPTPVREVATARGRYTLRGVLLPPGSGLGEAVLVSVAVPRVRALPGPDALRARLGLTRREAEVALLLADGLATAEVAERLFISPHTARHHVESVMGKLGLSRRAGVGARLLEAA